MRISLIIFIIVHVLTLAYVFELLRRLRKRVREYPLEDDKETIPFGLIRLRHMVVAYIVTYIIWVLFSIWLYTYFIGGSLPVTPSSTFINL